MKPSENEIKRVHDLLNEVVHDEELSAQVIDAGCQETVKCVLDALCWVLGHDNGIHFMSNVGGLVLRMQELGMMVDVAPGEAKAWTN